MHYVTDTKEIRDAKEKVTEAKENIQIAGLEKEISGLNDIIDDLDKKIEESNEYYDKLIEQTEKYWDSLIKGLEEYKSRWKELADIEEHTKMEIALKNLNITTEDVLNMSESAFESFKGTYLGLLNEMYSGNDDMIDMLQRFGGISTDALKPLSGTISDVADSIDSYSGSTSNANASTSEASESVGNLNTNTAELNGNLSGVSDTLDNMLEGNKFETIAGQINDVTESVQSLSDALGKVPDVDISDPIAQFDELGNSVDNTTASISGGNVSKAESGESSDKNTPNTQSKSNGSGGLISSIENLGETTAETLGEPDGDGAIGKFGELGDTIAEAENHVQGIIKGLNDLDGMAPVECTIVVNIETRGSIPQYADGTAISDTIDSMNLNSSKHTARYEGSAKAAGTALVSGNWAVQSDETNALVGEVGRELIVRQGRFFTVGDNGAEMVDIKKGDIVFNHEQTEQLLKNGHISGRGKAYADGTVGGGKFLTPDGMILEHYNPDLDPSGFWKLFKKWTAYMENIDNNVDKLTTNAMYEHSKQMQEITNQISNNTSIINSRNQPNINVGGVTITCPGVTDQEVVRIIHSEVNQLFNGFHNYADQYSRT